MRPLSTVLGVVVALANVSANFPARSPGDAFPPVVASVEPSPASEMALYEMERRQYQEYRSPAVKVRERAEAAAQQRTMRLEAQRWYGWSNARPLMSADPAVGALRPRPYFYLQAR